MAANGGRIAVISDEGTLLGIWSGRYSTHPHYETYLRAHASKSPLIIDRRGRAPEYIPAPALTVAIAVQPARLVGLNQIPELRDWGLLARLIYSLPANLLGRRKGDAPPVPAELAEDHDQRVHALLKLKRNEGHGEPTPHRLELSPAAQREWLALHDALERHLGPEGSLAAMSDWAGKLAGATARITGVLHMMEHAEAEPWATPASADTFRRARAIGTRSATRAPRSASLRDVQQWACVRGLMLLAGRDLDGAFTVVRGAGGAYSSEADPQAIDADLEARSKGPCPAAQALAEFHQTDGYRALAERKLALMQQLPAGAATSLLLPAPSRKERTLAEETNRPLNETEEVARIRLIEQIRREGCVARMQRAEQRRREQRRQRPFFRFVEVDDKLDKARRCLERAVQVSEGVTFDQEPRDVLLHKLENIRRLVETMDRAIVGSYRPGWGKLRVAKTPDA
jgi:hypothetical protein